jgi:hypothetical protein
MINPFQIIETDWVEYGIPGIFMLKSRIVAPLWIGWLIVRFSDVPMPNVVRRAFTYISRLAGAIVETKNVTSFANLQNRRQNEC